MNAILIRLSQDNSEYKLIVIVVILGVKHLMGGYHLKQIRIRIEEQIPEEM